MTDRWWIWSNYDVKCVIQAWSRSRLDRWWIWSNYDVKRVIQAWSRSRLDRWWTWSNYDVKRVIQAWSRSRLMQQHGPNLTWVWCRTSLGCNVIDPKVFSAESPVLLKILPFVRNSAFLISAFLFHPTLFFSCIEGHVKWTVNQTFTCDLIACVFPCGIYGWLGIKSQ